MELMLWIDLHGISAFICGYIDHHYLELLLEAGLKLNEYSLYGYLFVHDLIKAFKVPFVKMSR